MTAATLQLFYEDRRGAGIMKQVTPAEVPEALKRLRCRARLERDGEVAGGVEEVDNADDGRVRWNWWFDVDALAEHALEHAHE